MMDECTHLQSIATMDVCGQATLLLSKDHGSRPYVFGGIRSCELNAAGLSSMWGIALTDGSSTAQYDQHLGCVSRMHGGSASFLRPGQLETLETAKHMYSTVWCQLDAGTCEVHQSRAVDFDIEALINWPCNPLDDYLSVCSLSELCALVAKSQTSSDMLLWCRNRVCGVILRALQAITFQALNHSLACCIWLVTGSQQSELHSGSAAGAALGLVNVANIETASLPCMCVESEDVGPFGPSLIASLMQSNVNGHVKLRSCTDFVVSQLQQLPQSSRAQDTTRACNISQNVMLTGGTGALGLVVATWLVQHGTAQQLTLLSRSGESARSAAYFVTWLSESTSSVQVSLCDIGYQPEAVMKSTCQGLERQSIVHAAGVLEDAVLLQQTQAGLARVWNPKACAALTLHDAVCQRKHDMLVLFSSAAALLGSFGQSSYAAANSSLDTLSKMRKRKGLLALSIQWGAWAGSGMAAASGVLADLEQMGALPILGDQGLCALELAWAGSCPVVAMVPLRWAVVLARFEDQIPTFLEGFKSHRQCRVQESQIAESCTSGFMASVTGKDSEAVKEALERLVIEKVEEVAGVVVSREDALMESGVDSLAATELRNSLQFELGRNVKLAGALVFQFPSVFSIAQHIDSVMERGVADTTVDCTGWLDQACDLVVSSGCTGFSDKHPFLQRRFGTGRYAYIFTAADSDCVYQMLLPHKIGDVVMGPAAGHFEFVHMVNMLENHCVHSWLSDVSVLEPFLLDGISKQSPVEYHCRLSGQNFQVLSVEGTGNLCKETFHCSGSISSAHPSFLSVGTRLQGLLDQRGSLDPCELPTLVHNWSPVRPLWKGATAAVGRISLQNMVHDFCVNPVALSCLPSVLSVLFAQDDKTLLPYHVQAVGMFSSSNVQELWCSCEVRTQCCLLLSFWLLVLSGRVVFFEPSGCKLRTPRW